MSRNKLEVGTVVELGGKLRDLSRRRYLKALGLLGGGTLGLRTVVESVFGADAEGVPLVLTRDRQGNPDRVKIVPKEHRRRLRVYSNFDVTGLVERHPIINEVTVVQRGDSMSDLALKFFLDEDDRRARLRLPNTVQDVPVEHEVRPSSRSNFGGCQDPDAGCRRGVTADPIEANAQIGGGSGFGTLGVVGVHDGPSEYPCLVTADHVMEGTSTMTQPPGDRPVGSFVSRDQSLDATKYELDTYYDANIDGTMSSRQPDMSGWWTFDGLSSATSGGSIDCSYAGAESCYKSNAANNTSRSDVVDYEADMRDHDTESGDSGGPFVDTDGYLVCILHGCQWDWTNNHWDIGTTAGPMFDSLNVLLESRAVK